MYPGIFEVLYLVSPLRGPVIAPSFATQPSWSFFHIFPARVTSITSKIGCSRVTPPVFHPSEKTRRLAAASRRACVAAWWRWRGRAFFATHGMRWSSILGDAANVSPTSEWVKIKDLEGRLKGLVLVLIIQLSGHPSLAHTQRHVEQFEESRSYLQSLGDVQYHRLWL